MVELTIGMATYNDYDGVYFTLQALRLYQDLEATELLVVDNYGCEATKEFVEGWAKGRYVRSTEAVGTAAAKNLVFQEATGEAVLCCDSHVLIAPEAIARLKAYYREHPTCGDLLQGPLVYDDLQSMSTHFEPTWRNQMWGIWATDPRGTDLEGEPFEIPMQGMGVFSCRKQAWPGFNPRFRGFGGEEGYIHEKIRQAGGRCLCLPWLRWVHRFGRPAGVPYPLTVDDKLRNYLIGHAELGLDLTPVLEHFSAHLEADRITAIAFEALWDGGVTADNPSPGSTNPTQEVTQPVVDEQITSRRAIVCFVEDNPHLIQQLLALRHSWLFSEALDTDLVVMGPDDVLARLPDDLVKIPQAPVADDPVWRNYRFVNSIACMNGAGAEQLDRYTHVLLTDVDTFITPAWNQFHPTAFTFGTGGYCNDDAVRQRIQDIAAQYGLVHRGITNIHSTWYGPTQVVRRACAFSEMLIKHILTHYFASDEGEWPSWYRGVSSLYAGEIAVNHCAPNAERSDLLDASSASGESIMDYPHIHCWHTDDKFSKHAFMAGSYTLEDANGLNMTIVRDYCMGMSFRSLNDLEPFSERMPAGSRLATPSVLSDSDESRRDASRAITTIDGDGDVLDGVRPIVANELAALALERARLGAKWLASVVGREGCFPYVYRPTKDEYVTDRYNEVRHAGTTYALYQFYGASEDESVKAAAESAVHYICASVRPVAVGGCAYIFDDRVKLGGQALALVALLERRRVTRDVSLDDLIGELASFLLGMELAEEPGRLYNSYDPGTNQRLVTPHSDYYPGEALLALVRLAQQFPDGPYLSTAIRVATYLMRERDGDIVSQGKIPREDHWLTIALSELYRLDEQPDYMTVAYLNADSMMSNQYGEGHPEWWRIGGFRRGDSVNYTSSATKGEALVAAWELARYREDAEAAAHFSEGALRTAQFLMRVQYTAENTQHFPRPNRVVGAWAQDERNSRIRFDFVQHNVSALIGVWHMTRDGKLPSGSPLIAPRSDGRDSSATRPRAKSRGLTIRQTRVFSGPNIWAQLPVIHIVLDATDLGERSSNEIPKLIEHLAGLIPSLAVRPCLSDESTTFFECCRQGMGIPQILEHLILELQNVVDSGLTHSETRLTDERGVYDVVYGYCHEGIGLAAAELVVRLMNHVLYESEPDFDFAYEFEQQIVQAAKRLEYPISTHAIVSEAKRREIPVLDLDPDHSLVQFGNGKYQRRIWGTDSSITSHVAVKIARNKALTNTLLQEAGIPVPNFRAVHNVDDAVRAATRIGYPVVLKPLDGNHGRGVCIDLSDESKVREFFPVAHAQTKSGTVLVESHIPGHNHRILVINQQVVSVSERVPAHVIGDGVHTVRQLIAITNTDPRRGSGSGAILSQVAIDVEMLEVLGRQGVGLDNIPKVDQSVQLKLTGNTHSGATTIARFDDIHPDNAELARQAAMIIGLDIAGVDLITPDISQSMRMTPGAIVEVNSRPGLRSATYPIEGPARNVSGDLMEMLFPTGQPCRVPIVAVTGTNGTATTCRIIAHILKTSGHKVGLACSGGIYIDGTELGPGDKSGRINAQKVLRNPTIDYAALEAPRGEILRSGLDFERCDVAVVTNDAGDYIGHDGVDTLADLAAVMSVLPGAVVPDGATVLNADSKWTVEMAQQANGEIIFFGMDEENPVIRKHLREHGKAVVLSRTRRGEEIMILKHRRKRSLLLAHQIPATCEGHVRVGITNAMAAVAAAIAREVPLEHIRLALQTYENPLDPN
jgi:cyanophycin synthetase